MDRDARSMAEIVIAWCGPGFVLGYIIFWGIMGNNIPPPNVMGLSAQELVAQYYEPNRMSIAIGMAVSMAVAFLYLPWSCLLSSMIRDEEGSTSVFSNMELTGGTLTAWSLGFCPGVWLMCAIFVQDLDPNIIKAIHAFGWFIYDMTFGITSVQAIGIGVWTVMNRKQQMFPAWVGWCSIAVGIIFIPLVLLPFVKEGPFVIPGSWNYFVVFGTWLFLFFGLYSVYMIKALNAKRVKLRSSGLAHSH